MSTCTSTLLWSYSSNLSWQKIDPDSILETKFTKQQESSILGFQPVINQKNVGHIFCSYCCCLMDFYTMHCFNINTNHGWRNWGLDRSWRDKGDAVFRACTWNERDVVSQNHMKGRSDTVASSVGQAPYSSEIFVLTYQLGTSVKTDTISSHHASPKTDTISPHHASPKTYPRSSQCVF